MAKGPPAPRRGAKPRGSNQDRRLDSVRPVAIEPARLGWPAVAVAGAVSVACFATYWLTHGTGPYWQDSGLFLAALKTGGGLLSPGYPVYLLLGRPFVAGFRALLPSATFAEAGNTFSALWAALAAGLVCLSIRTVLAPSYRFFQPRSAEPLIAGGPRVPSPPGHHPAPVLVASALGGLLAGLSYSLWFQALTAEAYALNAFFAALVLFLVLRLGSEGALGPDATPRQRRLLLSLLAAHGLSCGNHPVTVVFLPALAWLIWTQRAGLRRQRLRVMVAGVYAGSALLPYLYLPWAAAAYPANPFSHVTSWRALVTHMLGSQWTGQTESFGLSSHRFILFPLQLWHELLGMGLLGLLAGLVMLRREQPRLLRFLVLFLLPAGLLPILYLRGGEYDFWLMPFYVGCFLVAGVGLYWPLQAAFRVRLPALVRASGVVAVTALAVGPMPIVNHSLVDRRGDSTPEDFGRNLYRHLAPNAVLIAISDQENALTYFLEAVEGLRPDVVRLDAGSVATPWYSTYLRRRYPGLHLPTSPPNPPVEMTAGDWLDVIVRANVSQRSIYASGRLPVQLPAGVAWVPAGGLWKTARAGAAVDLVDWEYAYQQTHPLDRPARDHAPERTADRVDRRQPYTAQVRLFHVQAWQNLGDWSLENRSYSQAVTAYQRALSSGPPLEPPGILFGLGKALFLADRNDEALGYLMRAGRDADRARAAEVALYLGQIHAAAGNAEAANQQFDTVRRLDPELWARIQASPRRLDVLPEGASSPRP